MFTYRYYIQLLSRLLRSLSGNDYLSTIDTDELYKFISRYKFIISYENSICNDYMTEKIWRTLIVGSVPVYFGAPNIKVGLHFLYYYRYGTMEK